MQVTDTIGYTANVGFQDGGSNVGVGANWSTSITYTQKFYETELMHHASNGVAWRVILDKYYHPDHPTGYGRDSDQLFQKELHTISDTAYENMFKIEDIKGLPARIFSPDMLAVIISEKTTPQYIINVKYQKHVDMYYLERMFVGVGYKYAGKNFKNIGVVSYNQKFKVDWKNHKLIPLQ